MFEKPLIRVEAKFFVFPQFPLLGTKPTDTHRPGVVRSQLQMQCTLDLTTCRLGYNS